MKKQVQNVQDSKKRKQTNKGITLIALVITIIVLLILAGISIATLTGENGLLTQANQAKTETIRAAAKEKVQVEVLGSYGTNGKINLDLLNKNLKENIKELTYNGSEISETNKITELPATVVVDGYEVTINSDGTVTVAGETQTPPSTALQPGDKATSTVKDNYTDGTATATIPEGFTISDKEGESTISTGLVVIGPDGSEFVWVPVDDINEMAQCGAAGGNCNLQLQNGHLKCTTHNSGKIVGKLYATATGENFGTVNTTYDANSGLREPAVVTGNVSGTGTEYDADTTNKYYEKAGYSSTSAMLEGLKNEYKLMVESVAKYGGFYVGRYETSLNTATETEAGTSGTVQSKAGVIPTSAGNSATNRWYGLYDKAKTYVASSVQSSMIWGSQYDAMLNWALDGADKDKVTTKGIGNNSSGSVTTTGNDTYRNDSINHIRDLGGNLSEWTLETYDTNGRTNRGGNYNYNSNSPSCRFNFLPSYGDNGFGSRLTLYLK